MSKFEEIVKAKKDYEALVRGVSKDDVLAVLAPLFEKHPTVKAVRWRQYTPYFNDGDPCRFNVHDNHLRFDTTGEEDGDYEDGFESYTEDPAQQAAMKDFDTALKIDKAIMERLFGDPVVVTISRDNTVEIDEHYQG